MGSIFGGRVMRKRRKSIAHRVFLVSGFLLLLVSAIAALLLAANQNWLPQEWQRFADGLMAGLWSLLPTHEHLKFLAWLGGIVLSAAGAAFTLLVSWHFAEINLPQRIEDLKKFQLREDLFLQPRFLMIARRGLGSVLPDIESSRLTLLRKWLSGWSE